MSILNTYAYSDGYSLINPLPPAPPPDTRLQNSVWGQTIPVSMGYRRVHGAVIWAGPERETNYRYTSGTAYPGGPVITTATSWDKVRSVAVSLGERLNPNGNPPSVRRLWINGKLAYSNGDDPPIVWDNTTSSYSPAGAYSDGLFYSSSGGTDASSANLPNLPPVSSPTGAVTFRFYQGTEDQLPDPEIVAELGALAPAYRGQIYLVIEDVIFGYDTATVTGGISDNITSPSTATTSQTGFPDIWVELVDTATSVVSMKDFTMLPQATPMAYSAAVLMTDYVNRRIAVVTPKVGSGGELWIADMDTATQTTCATITSSEMVGPIGTFAAWDLLNDIIYTMGGSSHSLIALGLDGSIISQIPYSPYNLAPTNSTGGAPTATDPAVNFPEPNQGDVDYVLNSGTLQPLVCIARDYVGVFTPSTSGAIPATLGIEAYYLSANDPHSIQGLHLYDKAISRDRLSNQDACFLLASASGVELMYVSTTIAPDGSIGAKILGRQTIHTPTYTGSDCVAFLDNDGNVIIMEHKISSTTLISKILMTTSTTPDFGVAPGWRGNFPTVTGYAYHDVTSDPGVVQQVWTGQDITNSDFTHNDYVLDATKWNLNTGVATTLSGYGAVGDGVWDSADGLYFWAGSITQTTAQTFHGVGLRYAQGISGIDGSVETIGDVVRAIGEYVGFTSGQVSVDATLVDEVPGVYIDKPYDISALFNAAGALYSFTFNNSGAGLSFSSSSNDPTYATGTWTVTSTTGGGTSVSVQDGDTATIGGVVYTFRTTPAAPFDVKISLDDVVSGINQLNAKEKIAANFLAAINADLSLAAADSQNPSSNPGFFAGTVKNSHVTAVKLKTSVDNFGFTSISLTATAAGVAGNSIATTSTGSHASFGHTTLTNGADPPPPVVTLTVADLALVSENQLTQNDAIVTTIQPPSTGQQAAKVDYFALEQNYVALSQTFIPDSLNGALTMTGASTVDYDVPFVMSTSEAYARVSKTAFQQAQNVVVQNFRLSQKYLTLEPSDIISVTIEPFVYQLRLDECTFNGDWSTSFSAVNYAVRKDYSVRASDVITLPQSVATGSDGLPVVIDAPALNPLTGPTPGSFTLLDGMRPLTSRFSQGVLSFTMLDAGLEAGPPEQLFVIDVGTKWGTIVGSMPAATEPLYSTHEDTITISCKTIVPASDLQSAASYVDFVAGKNCLAIGRPGNWEYVFFRDVTVLNDKTVTLTGLIRGQRGTDAAASNHTTADYAILLASANPKFTDDGLKEQAWASTEAGLTGRYYATGLPSTRKPIPTDVTFAGLTLYPFSPCRLSATLAAGNDIDLAWLRRDRFNTEFVTNPAIMSEASEKYDVEIIVGGVVKRTLTDLTSPAYTYTSAQQTTDGLTPGAVDTLEFRVYQKGELGRGFGRTDTVHVN